MAEAGAGAGAEAGAEGGERHITFPKVVMLRRKRHTAICPPPRRSRVQFLSPQDRRCVSSILVLVHTFLHPRCPLS